jgi:hypothetical protein
MKKTALLLATLVSTTALAAENEVVDLTITGGPNAGRHHATTERGGCSFGLLGKGWFGSQLSDPKNEDPKVLNSLRLIVPDPKKPAEFQLTAGFGSAPSRGTVYGVDTHGGKKSGSGTVEVEDKGSTAMVKFSATTKDGVKLEGTIDCKSVMRVD